MNPETLEALVPMLTALIGVGGTLGGVAISQRSSDKRERDRERERRGDVTRERVRETAKVVYDLLNEEKVYVTHTQKGDEDPDEWDAAYESHVYDELMSPLTRAIALVPDAVARSQMALTLRALTSGLRVNMGNGELYFFIYVILNSALSASSAYARGERPNSEELAQLVRTRDWIHAIEGGNAVDFLTHDDEAA
ncbi:hypothetical protein [uncultured Microbacterium sp.]|uniref:hypothetical protein n=1 Tax=uncultured Microbacterium sp. TaxID=191216 RepID=UPI0028E309AA|nr:hypothetical protein [uncultured Microbacterium sp.]